MASRNTTLSASHVMPAPWRDPVSACPSPLDMGNTIAFSNKPSLRDRHLRAMMASSKITTDHRVEMWRKGLAGPEGTMNSETLNQSLRLRPKTTPSRTRNSLARARALAEEVQAATDDIRHFERRHHRLLDLRELTKTELKRKIVDAGWEGDLKEAKQTAFREHMTRERDANRRRPHTVGHVAHGAGRGRGGHAQKNHPSTVMGPEDIQLPKGAYVEILMQKYCSEESEPILTTGHKIRSKIWTPQGEKECGKRRDGDLFSYCMCSMWRTGNGGVRVSIYDTKSSETYWLTLAPERLEQALIEAPPTTEDRALWAKWSKCLLERLQITHSSTVSVGMVPLQANGLPRRFFLSTHHEEHDAQRHKSAANTYMRNLGKGSLPGQRPHTTPEKSRGGLRQQKRDPWTRPRGSVVAFMESGNVDPVISKAPPSRRNITSFFKHM